MDQEEMFQPGLNPGEIVSVTDVKKVQRAFNEYVNLTKVLTEQCETLGDTNFVWQAMCSALATITYNSASNPEMARKALMKSVGDFYQFCVDGRHLIKEPGNESL